jgi:hypothetical protein
MDYYWRFIGWPTHLTPQLAKNRVAFAMWLWLLFKLSGTTIAEFYLWHEARFSQFGAASLKSRPTPCLAPKISDFEDSFKARRCFVEITTASLLFRAI